MDKPEQSCQQFLNSNNSLVLSTVNQNGKLETSAAPFVRLENRLYVYVSELSQHSQNLLWMADKCSNLNSEDDKTQFLVSALLIADEQQSKQIFARERLTLTLEPCHIARDSEKYAAILQDFAEQFGEIIDVLSGLDFYLIELNCLSGSYVKGFGQAFAFENLLCEQLQQKMK